MVDGWKRIVKDEDLKGGEFLTFEFDGSCLFDFCIYGQATCKKLGKSLKPTEVEDDDVIVLEDDGEEEVDGEDGDADTETDDVDNDGMEADDDDDRLLLDDPDNPSFTVILNPKKKSQLVKDLFYT